MTTRRSPKAAALVVVLAAATAACGGEQFPNASGARSTPPSTIVDAGKNPRARLLAAVQRVTDTKTARVALHMSFKAGGQADTISGTGLLDIAGRRIQMQLADTNDSSVTIQLRILDGSVYVNQGDGWDTTPYKTAALDQTPDPASYLDYLQGVADDVHVVGTGTVRGAYSTRYAATVDLGRALRSARNAAQRSALNIAVAVFGDMKIPTTVWIDQLGHLRKIALSINLMPAAKRLGLPAGIHATLDESLELYDYGVPVDIQVPANAKNMADAARDRGAQSDLRNALTAEKTLYTDQETYSTDATVLKQIEPSLDWGGKLAVAVGPADGRAQQTVCLSERSQSGTTFALADVAAGPAAGTYYGQTACPATVDESSFPDFATTGWK